MGEIAKTNTLISVEVYRDELIAFVMRKVGSHAQASDIVQETYLKFIGRSPAGQVHNPRAFLYRIARNLIIDGQRHDRITGRYVSTNIEIADVACKMPSPERVISGKQELALLKQAVLDLPPRCREVFILRKFEGLSQSEIAEKLAISRNMVEKHLRKALIQCRTCLASRE